MSENSVSEMPALLTNEEMRFADTYAIHALAIPELILMEHAALAVLKALSDRFDRALAQSRGTILIGFGNNGGDAAALARLLFQRGVHNFECFLLPSSKRSASLKLQLEILNHLGVACREISPTGVQSVIDASDWIIDGLFGTGLSRPLDGDVAKVVEAVNGAKAWTIAIDIPSGLNADTGNPHGVTVRAAETVAMGYLKKGLVTGQAADFVGQLTLAPIGIPRAIPKLSPDALLFNPQSAKLPTRKPASHKGKFGHVYIWSGTANTQGAAAMCAMSATAALRAGSGLVTLWGEPADVESLRRRMPVEVMTANYDESLFDKKDTVGVFGPGMGKTSAQWRIVKRALESDWKLILDGDALTLLAEHAAEAIPLLKARKNLTCLTPHPKEASRLLANDVAEVEKDRYQSVRACAKKWNAYVVLKGKGTLVTAPGEKIVAVTAGDSGLSKGGSGDVLAGIVASLVGQPGEVLNNVSLAVYLHGRASEWVTQVHGTERSHLAHEIVDKIADAYGELEACAK